MTVTAHLDLVLTDLLQAKERAELLSYPAELVERMDLLRRAVARLKRQIAEQPNEFHQRRDSSQFVEH